MSVERLLSTLLYEGYALYPYTPGATKNATPTPFGIVYPPVYAAGSPHTFDRARMQLVLEPGETVTGTLAFLEESGERRVELEADATVEFAFDDVQGRVRLATTPLEGGLVRVAMCVHNTTEVPEGLDRAGALRSSLRSTHLVAHAPGGRFASPVAPGPTAAAAVAAVRPRQHLPGPRDADTTTRCSARRSSCPTIRRSRPRATATCSTRRRSRRRCCCTCSRSATASARRSPSRTRRCARCWRAPRPRGRRP